MKYIQKTSKTIRNNFVSELLLDRGIIKGDKNFCRQYFFPTEDNELPPTDLDNIELAFQLLLKHLENGSHIYLVVDCDVDGYTSAAVFYGYLTKYLHPLYPNFRFSCHIPDGKEHGLETLMDDLTEKKKYDLIVCPDSASNDYECHEILSDMGYDICCLDHHIAPRYSDYAVVVNNQLSKFYTNKDLSGVGVVYKFLEYCDKRFEINGAKDYLDLVAVGEISDMMNMGTLENRYICDYGLAHIKNEFLRALAERQSFSIGDRPLTQMGVSFYITPLINALIRVGSQIEKENLFYAFIEPNLMVPSTKRGSPPDEEETIVEQVIRNCSTAKSRQKKEEEKVAELLDIQICENCLDDNKILILNADELDVPTTLTGLCAMEVAAKYKKPVILGRTTKDGKLLRGSIRGRDDSELKDFRQFLLDSNLMKYVEGQLVAR